MATDIATTRLEWERAHRRLTEALQDPAGSETLGLQLEAVTRELRKRIGGAFTLRELVAEYAHADSWAREVVSRHSGSGWPPTLAIVEGAAFHLYARGAVDYAP